MDSAQLWQLAALLARLDPDTHLLGHTAEQLAGYGKIKAIAQGSVSAGRLRCLAYYQNPDQNPVLMSEFLRWAQEKELAIPPELKPPARTAPAPTGTAPPARTAPAPTGTATTQRIAGINGLRKLIKELGLTLGDDAAVRRFAKRAGIMKAGDNPRHEERSWDRAEIEPKLREAIQDRLKEQTE